MPKSPDDEVEERMSLKDLEDDDDFDAFFSAIRASAPSSAQPAEEPAPAKPLIIDDDDEDWLAQAVNSIPHDPNAEAEKAKKKKAGDRSYPKQLPAREPDQVISEGSTEWPADAAMKTVKGEELTFEKAGEEIQKHASRLTPMALAELEEIAQAWRVDTRLLPTSLKAIEKILDLAGGSENKRPLPEKKKSDDLKDLASALMSGEPVVDSEGN